ncbi:MAG: DUF2341 domain-containing protein [Bacteroidia bacterium]|nr:DUF2341 domain-containing protein [Bacteroidia bacterium]
MHLQYAPIRSAALMLSILALAWGTLAAQPADFSDQLYYGGFNQAVGLTFDENGVMYVWEKGGRVWIVADSVKRAAPLINISEEVGNFGDHGMVGFALDPDYLNTGYIYLLYVVDRHYLMNFGTPAYNPVQNEYDQATIGRVTRYTVSNPGNPALAAVNPASRLVLVGETKETGMPIVHNSHGVGSLVFGTDGTLLVSCGDGASYNGADAGGATGGSYAVQALADGIIPPAQNVGAFRSQMMTSHNGKVLRIDPATGNGIPSNPFYQAGSPRSATSRTWALGLRNPCRMTLRPGTGSHNPADGNPGVLYIGDVGWYSAEELNVCTAPAQNFGWPLFEGMGNAPDYPGLNPFNQEAPAPGGCGQAYYRFADLLKQWNGGALPSFPDPCSPGSFLSPGTYRLFVHTKPAVRWRGGATLASRDNVEFTVGGADVPGPTFGGNCSMGGVWYTGTDFPAEYQNTYFHSDYGQNWLRRFVFSNDDKIQSVHNFAVGIGAVVGSNSHPLEGGLYYIRYQTEVRKYYYGGNKPPKAVASPAVSSTAASSLLVNFTGSASSDPENGALSYLWNFGDGSPGSALANPAHTFTAAPGVPALYTVTLTVTDPGGLSNSTSVIVSLNNTPPVIVSSSLDGISTYSMAGNTVLPLNAVVNDAEHSPAQIGYAWQTTLHHDTHTHPEGVDNTPSTSTIISPLGCDPHSIYFYRITLTVTDAAGLSDTLVKDLYPDCQPLARNDTASYLRGGSTVIQVLGNDDHFGQADTMTIAAVTPPLHGTLSFNALTASFTYQHGGSPSGSDSFTYTFLDKLGNSAGTATVVLNEVPPPSVVITSPAGGQTLAGSALSVSYSLGGTLLLAEGLEFVLDGGAPVPDPSLDGQFTLENLTPGPHTLIARLLGSGSIPLVMPESSDTVQFTTTSLSASMAYYKILTVESDYVYGSAPHAQFPVLVSFTDPDLRTAANGGFVQHPAGYDIVFTSTGNADLKFQVERYNPSTGELIAWVNIPSLPADVDTDFLMHFGSAAVSSYQGSDATWNSAYQGRWHMHTVPGAQPLEDGTAGNHDGAALGGLSAANQAAGKIGYGVSFDGADDYFDVGAVNAGTQFTLGAWIYSNQADAGFHGFLGNSPGATNQRAPSMWVYQQTALHFGFGDGANWNGPATPAGVISQNSGWNYVVTTFNGTSYVCYVDGNPVFSSNAYAGLTPFSTPVSLIGRVDNFFQGSMDEVHVSNVARSADWIKTEYYSQHQPNDFIRVMPGNTPTLVTITAPAEGQNLFGTTVQVQYQRSGNQLQTASVQLALSGQPLVNDPAMGGSYTYTGLAAGSYQLIVRLLNAASAVLASDTVHFTLQPYSGAFANGRLITIHEEEVYGTAPHADFPVMIDVTLPELRHTLNGGDVQHALGYDIRFLDSWDVPLDFQVELYDPAAGRLVAWVRVPSLPTDVDSYLKLVFGNPGLTDDPSAETTWNSGYLGRWHMNQNPAGAAPQLTDATPNPNNGTAFGGMAAGAVSPGMIGNGTCFDGSNDYFDVGNNVLAGQAFTQAAWVQSNQLDNSWHGFLGKDPGAVVQRAPSLWVWNATYIHGGFGDNAAWGNAAWTTSGPVIDAGGTDWNYVVATYENQVYRLYSDGNLVFTYNVGGSGINYNTPVSWIGRVDNYFRGCLDEVSVSSVVRSASWIQTEYSNIRTPNQFYTLGDLGTFPVEWLEFTAVPEQGTVQLRWTTASELNNDYFTVERSADGTLFEALQQVDGAGTSREPRSYRAEDGAPLAGRSFYRIRQTDLDGQQQWSQTVEVYFGSAEALTLESFPNPVSEVLTVRTSAPAQIRLYDLAGRELHVPQQADPAGLRVQLEVSQLPAGVYVLEARAQGLRVRRQVLVERP